MMGQDSLIQKWEKGPISVNCLNGGVNELNRGLNELRKRIGVALLQSAGCRRRQKGPLSIKAFFHSF